MCLSHLKRWDIISVVLVKSLCRFIRVSDVLFANPRWIAHMILMEDSPGESRFSAALAQLF